eukprot:3542408-Amphidinium_carterae.1
MEQLFPLGLGSDGKSAEFGLGTSIGFGSEGTLAEYEVGASSSILLAVLENLLATTLLQRGPPKFCHLRYQHGLMPIGAE